jgi:hypothetical protein
VTITATNLAGFFHISQKAASWMLPGGFRPYRQHYGDDFRAANGIGRTELAPARFKSLFRD